MTPCSARMRYAATRSSTWLIGSLSDWSIGSVRLDSSRRDDARPPVELALHERAEALRAAAHRDHALLGEQLAHIRLLQQRVELGVDLVDYRPARPGRGKHAVPGIDLQVRQPLLLQRRDIGKSLRALTAHHCQHAQLAALNVGRDGLQ